MRLVRDTGLLFAYELERTLRNPLWTVFGLTQPVLWLVLFSPLLDRLGEGGELAAFVPGVLVMLALYSALFVGFGLVADLRAGVLERLAVTPATRAALVGGRVLRDLLVVLVQAELLLAVAAAMGLRADAAGVAVALALLALVAVVAAAFSYAAALAVRDENGLASSLNFLTLPLLLTSGIVLPMTLAPGWLRAIAHLNPFYHAVVAGRDLFAGQLSTGPVWTGFAVLGALAAATLAWAIPSFRRVAA
jgi:ABC-2 type transport system permease protein